MYKDNIEGLIEKIKTSRNESNKLEDLRFIENLLNSIGKYFEAVIEKESVLNISKYRMNEYTFKKFLELAETKEETMFEACYSNLMFCNRLCNLYGIELIFNLKDKDQKEIIKSVIKPILDEYYEQRMK